MVTPMSTHLEWTHKAQKEKSLSVANSPVTLWYVHTDTVIVFLSAFLSLGLDQVSLSAFLENQVKC